LILPKWARDEYLTRTPAGFEGKIKIPWGTKVTYKFIVDGEWTTCDAPTEADQDGNLNNIYTSPPRPATPNAAANGLFGEGVSTTGKQLKMTTPHISGTKPHILSDIASTIIACDGAPSAIAYVATGLGVAIQNVVGVDPINADKARYFHPTFSWKHELISNRSPF
jgi:hypothetical protein